MISIKLHCNFIEIALLHECSLVNLLHIFWTPFSKNTSGPLLPEIHARKWSLTQSIHFDGFLFIHWISVYIYLRRQLTVETANKNTNNISNAVLSVFKVHSKDIPERCQLTSYWCLYSVANMYLFKIKNRNTGKWCEI